MGRLTSKFNSTLFFRVGGKNDTEQLYESNQVRFGCPANWLWEAIKEKNQSIGDVYECIFAHLQKNDPRVKSQKDIMGKPMGDNLLVVENTNGVDCLLRYIPTILIPTACFCSVDVEKVREEINSFAPRMFFDLDQYRIDMGYGEDDAGFLFIKQPPRFIEELAESIPKAVKKNIYKLTTQRFYGDFNPLEPVFANTVNYSRHKQDELFYDNPGSFEEMFWKMPGYEYQSEVRVIIPNINFKRPFDINHYDKHTNSLLVELPHLKEYAVYYSAQEAHTLIFENFDDSQGSMDFSISPNRITHFTRYIT